MKQIGGFNVKGSACIDELHRELSPVSVVPLSAAELFTVTLTRYIIERQETQLL